MSSKAADVLAVIGIGAGIASVVFAFVLMIFFFLSWILQLLWNGVLVDIFPTIPEIGYWKACGVYLLSGLLFKSPNLTGKTKGRK